MALGLGTILGIANAGLGLTGALGQKSSAKGLSRRATQQSDEALRLLRERQASNAELRRSLDAQGAFDPDAQIAQATRDLSHAEALQQGNLAARAKILGYRPGDGAPINQARASSETYNIRLAGVLQGIRQQAFQRRIAATAIDDPTQLASALMQQSQANAQEGAYQGQQAGANLGNVLTGALASLPAPRQSQPAVASQAALSPVQDYRFPSRLSGSTGTSSLGY